MKCFSLFSGCGGFDIALKNQGHDIVGGCEIDKHARSVYTRHFPDHPLFQDAREIKPAELPNFDLLTAGFPCQTFSFAGNKRGFEEPRGTLFFEIARIIREKRPRLLLLENVKGLLSHDNGQTFTVILSALDECGYNAEWQVINSKYFLPQNRERVFIVGYIRDTPAPQVFPIHASSTESNKKIRKKQSKQPRLSTKDHTGTITAGYSKMRNPMTLISKRRLTQLSGGQQGQRIYRHDGISSTLTATSGGQGGKTGLYAVPVCLPGNTDKKQNGRWFKEHNEPSFTLMASRQHGVYNGKYVRRLTPKECERLQGFDDDYTKYGKDDEIISDTQRYKMIGNAVTVPVVEFILKRMKS